jgi:sensor histidine kinase regulating citrate/malate metabolism
LNDNNVSDAQKYIHKLTGNLNETVLEKYCDNYEVNVILSSYIKKAQQEQIEVTSEIHLPEDLKIDEFELCAIFANAIDNAINACKKIRNPSDRRINIICIERCSQIYIRIINPVVDEVPFDGEYPVSNSIDHGIGTKSIAAIAQKHGGVFSFVAKDGIFKTTVTLKC